MPGTLMDHFENEYIEISKRIAEMAYESNPSSFTLNEMKKNISSAQQILDQIEMEIVSGHFSNKEFGIAKLKTFRNDLARFQKDIARIINNHQDFETPQDRDRLLSSNKKGTSDGHDLMFSSMKNGSVKLDGTEKMALEAEQIGATVLSDLKKQREQLQHASMAVHETDQDLIRSNRILKDMLRKVKANKLTSIAIFTLLLLGILLILFSKIRR